MNCCECCGQYRPDVELYETSHDEMVLLCKGCAFDLRDGWHVGRLLIALAIIAADLLLWWALWQWADGLLDWWRA